MIALIVCLALMVYFSFSLLVLAVKLIEGTFPKKWSPFVLHFLLGPLLLLIDFIVDIWNALYYFYRK